MRQKKDVEYIGAVAPVSWVTHDTGACTHPVHLDECQCACTAKAEDIFFLPQQFGHLHACCTWSTSQRSSSTLAFAWQHICCLPADAASVLLQPHAQLSCLCILHTIAQAVLCTRIALCVLQPDADDKEASSGDSGESEVDEAHANCGWSDRNPKNASDAESEEEEADVEESEDEGSSSDEEGQDASDKENVGGRRKSKRLADRHEELADEAALQQEAADEAAEEVVEDEG